MIHSQKRMTKFSDRISEFLVAIAIIIFFVVMANITGHGQTNAAPTSTPNLESIPEVKFVEKLPDNSFIVQIDGTKYRALPAEKIREFQLIKIERDSLKTQNEIYEVDLKKLAENRDKTVNRLIADYEEALKIERERTKVAEEKYIQEVEKGKLKSKKKSKVVAVLDSPITRTVLQIITLLFGNNLFKK